MMTRFFAAVAVFFVLTVPGMARELCPVEDIYRNDAKCADKIVERVSDIIDEMPIHARNGNLGLAIEAADFFIQDYNTWKRHLAGKVPRRTEDSIRELKRHLEVRRRMR